MANRGGVPEYVGAVAAVAAVAALMSTVDSALLSVTNHLVTDWLRNWLMAGASDRALVRVSKLIALVVAAGCVGVALYDPVLKYVCNPAAATPPAIQQSVMAWRVRYCGGAACVCTCG